MSARALLLAAAMVSIALVALAAAIVWTADEGPSCKATSKVERFWEC